jgi:hypothetical protein
MWDLTDRARRGENREKRGEKLREKKSTKQEKDERRRKQKKKKEEVGVEGRHPEPMLFPVFASSNAYKPSKFFVPSPSIFNYMCIVQCMHE